MGGWDRALSSLSASGLHSYFSVPCILLLSSFESFSFITLPLFSLPCFLIPKMIFLLCHLNMFKQSNAILFVELREVLVRYTILASCLVFPELSFFIDKMRIIIIIVHAPHRFVVNIQLLKIYKAF